MNQGTYVEPSRQTVAEFAAQWLKAIAPTVRPSTHHCYGRLGHSSIAVTLDVYSHVVEGLQAEAANLVAGLITATD